MSKIVQLKDRLGTHENEYPITLAEAVLMPNGNDTLADAFAGTTVTVDTALDVTSTNPISNKAVTEALANAGAVKDITVDGVSVLDTTTGIAEISIPETASLDLTTNKLTVGTTVLDNILTQADLDNNLVDAANTAVTAATANAVVGFVGSLADIDSNGDGVVDAVAPTTVVAAINKVASNSGKIESVSVNGTAVTIDAAKNVNIPAASSTVEGVVKVTDTYSATGTEAITGKGVANAFATLTANDAAVAGQYVTSVTEANGTITVTRTDIPVQDVLVNSASIVGADHKVNLDTSLADYAKKADLKMAAEVGGANKVLTTVNEANGVVTATAVDAVVKDTTAATGDAYSYTIAGATTKVELPIATDSVYGEVKVDTALSATSENTVQNKAIVTNTGLVTAITENAAKSDGTATGTAPTTIAEAVNNVAKNAGAIGKVATTDGDLTIADKKVTIPDATTAVKGLVNVTETYSATDATKAMTGKAVADAFTGLALAETGGANKIITTVKEENGVVTATAQDAVVKATTPAATNAAEYTIAGAATKVELAIATDTTFGEVKYDNATIGVNTDKQLIVKEPFQFLGDATATALNAADIATVCAAKVPAGQTVTKNMVVSIYNADNVFLGQMIYDGAAWIVFMKSTPYTVTFM